MKLGRHPSFRFMAFLGQLTANVQAHLNSVKPQLNSVIQSANRARNNLVPMLNRASAQLDSIGKILQVTGDRKQSPVDILPAYTSFDAALEGASFNYDYPPVGEMKLMNVGESLQLHLGSNVSGKFSASFIGDECFILERILFHWGTEPMNGSEHTVGGVGYAGEIHFIHRNSKFNTVEQAHKEINGAIVIAVLLNESHDDNQALRPIIDGIQQIIYKGSECTIQHVQLPQLIPPIEKRKEFWIYEGSETVSPFRENVQWIIFRSTISISSHQLDTLRTLQKEGYECEIEQRMHPIRAVQPIIGRIIRSSFRSGAQASPVMKS